MCSSCWGGVAHVLWLCRRAEDHDEKRKDFEFKVAFLKKVPLLMNHLPRSELPKMANSLTSRVWRPGQTLVSQGDTGKALYLIQSGVALVYVREAASRPPELRCTLKSGDYFGGHTLLTSRPNIATIVAGQSEEGDLVTLSMSRGVFEESGLKRWLHFPKRPALYQGRGENESGAAKAAKATKKSPLEERVIRKALLENANLRAFVKLEPEQMDGLVQSAERREVGAGTVIAKRGEAANELIIVCSGEVEVVLSENNEKATSSTASVFDADFSLEAKMGKRGMAERMIRKQQFLQQLTCSTATPKERRRQGTPRRASDYGSRGSVDSDLGDDAGAPEGRRPSPGQRWGPGPRRPRSGNAETSPEGRDSRRRQLSNSFGILADEDPARAQAGELRRNKELGRGGSESRLPPELRPFETEAAPAAAGRAGTLPAAAGPEEGTAVEQRLLQSEPSFSRSLSTRLQGERTPSRTGTWTPSRRPRQPRQGTPGARAAGLAEGLACRSTSSGVIEATPSTLFGADVFSPSRRASSHAETEDEVAVLVPGDSFGELAVLYHLRREATFRVREDCVLFAITRAEFMRWCQHHHRKITEYVKVLDEVHALQSLLSSERYELACHVHSVVDFKPGERILHQNKERKARQWYVVSRGGAEQHMLKEAPDGTQEKVWLADLRRGSHFGERSLLRGDTFSQSNVDTCEGGMTCLVFEYVVVAEILEKVFRSPGGELPSPDCPIQEWCQRLAEGWNNHHTEAIGVKKRGQTVQFENLRKRCCLGRGGFCKVALVEDVSSKKRYALKTMSKGYLSECGAERQIRWERELLSIVDSPFIINLHKTFIDAQHVYFLLEAALGGSLADVVADRPEVFLEDRPRGSAAAFYVGCLVLALEHLHTRSIAHRDVKTENVLLDENGYAKLCDMGFARFVLGKTSTLAGTPEYMAPEMIDFPHTHDQSVDWWAVGVLTFELLSGQTPFEDEGITEPRGRLLAIRRSQESGKLAFPFNFPHVSKAFVNAVLRKLPHRLGAGQGGADQLKAHPMFGAVNLDWAAVESRLSPAPFSKQWDDHAVEDENTVEMPVDLYGCVDDRAGGDGSQGLGFAPGDSLFVPCPAEVAVEAASIDWERLLS